MHEMDKMHQNGGIPQFLRKFPCNDIIILSIHHDLTQKSPKMRCARDFTVCDCAIPRRRRRAGMLIFGLLQIFKLILWGNGAIFPVKTEIWTHFNVNGRWYKWQDCVFSHFQVKIWPIFGSRSRPTSKAFCGLMALYFQSKNEIWTDFNVIWRWY